MGFRRFEDIPAWQVARSVERGVARITSDIRFRQDWDLRCQLRRAAASMMANVAEGFSRRSDKEFVQFLFMAKASAAEVQSHLYVALGRGYLDQRTFSDLYAGAENFSRQISGFISYLMGRRKK